MAPEPTVLAYCEDSLSERLMYGPGYANPSYCLYRPPVSSVPAQSHANKTCRDCVLQQQQPSVEALCNMLHLQPSSMGAQELCATQATTPCSSPSTFSLPHQHQFSLGRAESLGLTLREERSFLDPEDFQQRRLSSPVSFLIPEEGPFASSSFSFSKGVAESVQRPREAAPSLLPGRQQQHSWRKQHTGGITHSNEDRDLVGTNPSAVASVCGNGLCMDAHKAAVFSAASAFVEERGAYGASCATARDVSDHYTSSLSFAPSSSTTTTIGPTQPYACEMTSSDDSSFAEHFSFGNGVSYDDEDDDATFNGIAAAAFGTDVGNSLHSASRTHQPPHACCFEAALQSLASVQCNGAASGSRFVQGYNMGEHDLPPLSGSEFHLPTLPAPTEALTAAGQGQGACNGNGNGWRASGLPAVATAITTVLYSTPGDEWAYSRALAGSGGCPSPASLPLPHPETCRQQQHWSTPSLGEERPGSCATGESTGVSGQMPRDRGLPKGELFYQNSRNSGSSNSVSSSNHGLSRSAGAGDDTVSSATTSVSGAGERTGLAAEGGCASVRTSTSQAKSVNGKRKRSVGLTPGPQQQPAPLPSSSSATEPAVYVPTCVDASSSHAALHNNNAKKSGASSPSSSAVKVTSSVSATTTRAVEVGYGLTSTDVKVQGELTNANSGTRTAEVMVGSPSLRASGSKRLRIFNQRLKSSDFELSLDCCRGLNTAAMAAAASPMDSVTLGAVPSSSLAAADASTCSPHQHATRGGATRQAGSRNQGGKASGTSSASEATPNAAPAPSRAACSPSSGGRVGRPSLLSRRLEHQTVTGSREAVPAAAQGGQQQPESAAAAAGAQAPPARSFHHRTGGPCDHCGCSESPQWRRGPPNKPTLCNACGTRYRRTNVLAALPAGHAGAKAAAAAAAAVVAASAAALSSSVNVEAGKAEPSNSRSAAVAAPSNSNPPPSSRAGVFERGSSPSLDLLEP